MAEYFCACRYATNENWKCIKSIRPAIYIINFIHYLDATGNIPKQIPIEAGELANFLALVVDSTTKTKQSNLTSTDIRCFNKGCYGNVESTLRPQSNEIYWDCPECENEGVISHWEGTRWDNIM